jgi:UDP-N-acetylmuramoyl-L-alanyl-D-glutamate--2,6-diaminopimelate ligase
VNLRELFQGVEAEVPAGAAGVEVRSLAVDSRAVAPGALFAALPGVQADGARFAPQAVQAGAAAVLASHRLDLSVPVVVARDPRRAFSLAAAAFHGHPSRRLQLLGVTGTNGKTTSTWLVEQLATALGLRAGLLGTVEWRWPGERITATHTTPESHDLQALLARMAGAGVQVAAMEVSSHALSQERAAGCAFAAAAFTNLTRDHLDYHGTMEAYFAAKARLFRELLPRGAPAVLNLDDPAGARLAAEPGPRVLGFTARGAAGAAIAADGLQSGLDGISFELKLSDGSAARVQSPLIGRHNAENLLVALGLLLGLGHPLDALAAACAGAHGAPGRLERVPDPQGRVVLVDYAHSDDALARVLDSLLAARSESRKPNRGSRVLCVFGCGGDRDRGKRPLMGEAAGRRADLTVATSDNPRSEDPLSILADVEPGLRRSGRDRLSTNDARAGRDGYCVVPDRREAIELALRCARPGDAVLIAGKGHEPYQIVGAVRHEFDDRVEARRALEALS